MEISVEINVDAVVIKVSGELIGSSGLVELDIQVMTQINKGYKKIILELSKVVKIDSTGLGTLIVSKGSTVAGGGQIVLANVSEQIKTSSEITKINEIFITCDSVEQALLQF